MNAISTKHDGNARAVATWRCNSATNEAITLGGTVATLTRDVDNRHRVATLRAGNAAPVLYGYDDENRLSAVSTPAFVAEYTYTTDGWDVGYTITLTNGVTLSRELSRNPYRRNLIQAITNRVNNMAVSLLAYDYDVLNRATARNADTFGYNARGEVTSASILSNAYAYAYDFIGSAPSEARRFLRGASPRRARTSHPLVPSVGTMEEESNPNEVV